MEFLWRQVQRVSLVQVLRTVVVDAFLALANTVGVTPSKQTRQLGCQHSGTLWRQIKHFTTIHSRPDYAQPEAFFASLSFFLVHFTNTGWRICTLCVLFRARFNFTIDEILRFGLSLSAQRVCKFNEYNSFTAAALFLVFSIKA